MYTKLLRKIVKMMRTMADIVMEMEVDTMGTVTKKAQ